MFGLPIPPFITSWLIKIGVCLVITISAFVYGYSKGVNKGNITIAALIASSNAKIAELNKKNNDVNTIIETQYIVKWKLITEKQQIYVDAAKHLVPDQTNLSKGWVYLHDATVNLNNINEVSTKDLSDSGIKSTEALSVILSNYAVCQKNAEQLTQLQQWIINTKKNVSDSNKEKRN